MTHPPGGPVTPPPPSGPRTGKAITPIDPNSPGGRAAAEALSEVLAEILVAIWRRRSTSRAEVAA